MVRIAVCGQIPTITNILRRDKKNQITEYHDGALLGLKLGQEKAQCDLILVESYYGEGLPPMQPVARIREMAPIVYLMAEPPGNVAKIELGMLLNELREKKKEKKTGEEREKSKAGALPEGGDTE
ncbi:MAG: hypothetical protein Q4E24_16905 [bacterium]|nr:hypothetical protein [bacterium]